MELTKAIELLDDLHNIPDTYLDPDYLDAIALGKVALGAIVLLRMGTPHLNLACLPGETPPPDHATPTTLFSLGY